MCLAMLFTQINHRGTQLVNRQPSSVVIGCSIHDLLETANLTANQSA